MSWPMDDTKDNGYDSDENKLPPVDIPEEGDTKENYGYDLSPIIYTND